MSKLHIKQSRCPNGTRRNKTSGECEPKSHKGKASANIPDWKTSLETGQKYMVRLENGAIIHGRFVKYLNVDGTHTGLIISNSTIHHGTKKVDITGNMTFQMGDVKGVSMNKIHGGKSRKGRKSRKNR